MSSIDSNAYTVISCYFYTCEMLKKSMVNRFIAPINVIIYTYLTA